MLQHKVAIIVPSTINGVETAPKNVVEQWVRTAKLKFAYLFGGFTAHAACGGWVSDQHGLIEEPVTVIASFTDDGGLSLVDDVRELAARMAESMGQEAVSVEVNHSLEFVSPALVAG